MRARQLKMNPTKFFLGVSSSKFLGFIVTSKETNLDPDKVKAIQSMYPPKNLKELRGLQGRLAYIRRFIVNLSSRCQAFTRLIKKGVFLLYGIKPVRKLSRISKDTSLNLQSVAPYIKKTIPALRKSYGPFSRCSSYSKNDNSHEQAIYYLSRTLIGAESRYNPIEK